MTTYTLRDASDEPEQEPTFPAWVSGFTALGFTQIGRVLPANKVNDSYFTLYGPEHEAMTRRSVTDPTPVFVSPDRDAFVEISEWFFDTPSIRIRTVLDDGSLVETQRRWEHPLQPAVGLARHGSFSRPIADEMMQTHAPMRGRSVQIADGSAPEIWEAHRGHVARHRVSRSSTKPITHESITAFIATETAAHQHDQLSMITSRRSMARYLAPVALSPLLFGPLLFGLLASQLEQPLPLSPTVAQLAGPAIFAVGYWFFFVKVFPGLPFRRVRPRLRPKLEVPFTVAA